MERPQPLAATSVADCISDDGLCVWRSFCEYPQELGIQFNEGEVSVCQIQLLSHQYLIATKIELFAGVGESYSTARFRRLGCVTAARCFVV